MRGRFPPKVVQSSKGACPVNQHIDPGFQFTVKEALVFPAETRGFPRWEFWALINGGTAQPYVRKTMP